MSAVSPSCRISAVQLRSAFRVTEGNNESTQLSMKILIISLAAFLIALVVLTSRSRLEKVAESLANMISERLTCGFTPAFLGYDGVAGRYDFDVADQQNFQLAYAHYLAEAESRVSNMTPDERTEMCENALRSE